MRVATWNVNGVRARLEFVLRWLAERQPDVVTLQELKVQEDRFPHAELEAAGYRAAVHGQKSWNGVAVLSKAPLRVVARGLPGQEERGARFVAAETAGLLVASAYVPNGKHVGHPDFSHKLAWLRALAEYLATPGVASQPLVLGGDFNVCPAAIDSWNEAGLAGTIFHTDQERAAFRRLCDGGLHDLFRETQPDLQAFSWWDYRGGAFHRRQGLRIDLLLATEPLRARVRAVAIDRDWRKKRDGLTPSDHAPVVVDLAP